MPKRGGGRVVLWIREGMVLGDGPSKNHPKVGKSECVSFIKYGGIKQSYINYIIMIWYSFTFSIRSCSESVPWFPIQYYCNIIFATIPIFYLFYYNLNMHIIFPRKESLRNILLCLSTFISSKPSMAFCDSFTHSKAFRCRLSWLANHSLGVSRRAVLGNGRSWEAKEPFSRKSMMMHTFGSDTSSVFISWDDKTLLS